MRFINNTRLTRMVDLSALEAAKASLHSISQDEAKRDEFIKKRSNVELWTALRPILWGIGGCKCWYSETILEVNLGQVEHFRPKGRITGEDHCGYWWRAFDWTNYRLAHPIANMRVTDDITSKIEGKGCYFPLKPGCKRAKNEKEESNEIPLLLDPTVPGDCRLLCFDTSSGKPIPRFSKDENEWLFRRADESIGYFHLDDGTWTAERLETAVAVRKLCQDIDEAAVGLEATRDDYEQLVDSLIRHLDYTAEYSSIAFQVAKEQGILERIIPLPSAARADDGN